MTGHADDPQHQLVHVAATVGRHPLLGLIGATATDFSPGRVVVELPYRTDLCQQNGFLHAGIVTTIADAACGFAALTLMPAGSDVLSVEFKINMMSPARGELFRAVGTVAKAGRTLSVCQAEVLGLTAGQPDRTVALMQATMITRPASA